MFASLEGFIHTGRVAGRVPLLPLPIRGSVLTCMLAGGLRLGTFLAGSARHDDGLAAS
jgi:hypothetical protein